RLLVATEGFFIDALSNFSPGIWVAVVLWRSWRRKLDADLTRNDGNSGFFQTTRRRIPARHGRTASERGSGRSRGSPMRFFFCSFYQDSVPVRGCSSRLGK